MKPNRVYIRSDKKDSVSEKERVISRDIPTNITDEDNWRQAMNAMAKLWRLWFNYVTSVRRLVFNWRILSPALFSWIS